MNFSLLWMPKVLTDAGLQISEVPGWQNRGHGDEGSVKGIICHHTCGPLHGEMLDLNVIVAGRPDLGGPLAQLALGRTGIFHIVAAGKCWHAGGGAWAGITDGNAHFIGIEAENTGMTSGPLADPWPAVQMDAYKRGCAAILKHIGAPVMMCIGHKEWALPHGRKDDPSFDMAPFRAEVAKLMGEASAPSPAQTAPVPAAVPPAAVPAKPSSRIGTVNTPSLNIRKAPGAVWPIVGHLAKGASVTITGEIMVTGDKWYAIQAGFVAARYIDIKG